MATTNQNASQIQQMIRALEAKVDGITIMLTAFDTRVSKLEQRMDKLEDEQKTVRQWENDEHQVIREAVQVAKDDILTKLETFSAKSWEQRIGHMVATFGWIVAIGIFVLGYIINFILSHPTPGK